MDMSSSLSCRNCSAWNASAPATSVSAFRSPPASAAPAKLTEAVSLMEANIEEPLSTDDIAYYVGVSRRQLERLFKQYLSTVPSKYYLELRLNRARQLLQQTSKSIVQIGLACGFSSGPHFSSTYRNHFGITPREERSHRTQTAIQEIRP